MDLGLTSESGGEFLRFKASVNGWFVDGAEKDIKGLTLDPSSLKTGWGQIQEGEAPDWVWDEKLGVRSAQPSKEHRRGFSIQAYIKDVGWREWSANTVGSLMGLTALWSKIDPQLKDNQGKAVQVAYKGSTAEQKGKGTTRIPNFEIVKWVAMPTAQIDGAMDTVPAPKEEVSEEIF